MLFVFSGLDRVYCVIVRQCW